MPGEFGDHHGGNHRLGGQPTLDQPFGRRRLHDRLLAGAAGILRAVGHNHLVARRDRVEPLRGLLADHMHGRSAAWAISVLGLDRHMHPRQVSRKRTAIDAALGGTSTCGNWILLVVLGLAARNRLLDILERQIELIRIELLRTPAELHALQLMQKVLQAVVLCEDLVALRDRGTALSTRRGKQRLQKFNIGGKWIGAVLAHTPDRIRFAPACGPQCAV